MKLTEHELKFFKPNIEQISPVAQAVIDFMAPAKCPNMTTQRIESLPDTTAPPTPNSGLVEESSFVPRKSIVLLCQGYRFDDMTGSHFLKMEGHPCTTENCDFYRRKATFTGTVG